jgi:serine/threonine protein kinase
MEKEQPITELEFFLRTFMCCLGHEPLPAPALQHPLVVVISGPCAGVVTTLSLSLKYAAPEAVKALQDSQRTIVSDPAVDMWALGVIAYELLMGKAVFPRGMNASDISACLAGSAPLPWETRQLRQRRLPELRFLRRSVMSCLQRDPLNRPTSQQLLQTWNNLFDSHSREQ